MTSSSSWAAAAAPSSASVAGSAAAASKRAAAEELNLVEQKLEEVDRQLSALEEERAVLLARQASLKEQLNAKAVDVDWSGRFAWDAEAARVKAEVFGIAAPFRPMQREAINCTISGHDCFVIMRTGGGKSLVYQLPALLDSYPGLSLVISPLISLICDQTYQLEQIAFGKAAMLTSSQTRDEGTAVMQRVRQAPGSGLRLLYVTPEKVVKSKSLLNALEKVNSNGQLARIVVDEAHCCSEWGHEYRPDYARLGMLRKLFPSTPILAVTATATPHVIRDVSEILSLRAPELFRTDSNRPNLFYCVQDKPADNEGALKALARFILGEHRGQSGIVYCFSQKESEKVAEALNQHSITAAAYHAGLDTGVKDRVLRRWTQGCISVVSATIAFGMGISKPDVRFVVHFSISKSAESYIQESGRAGRDGQPSTCLLLYRASDAVRQASLCVTERMGLKKLRAMIEYAQQAGQCRRLPLARALGERLHPGACGGGTGCDVCSGRVRCERVEVTGPAKALIALVRAAGAKEKGRITHRALAEAFVKGFKKELAGAAKASKGKGQGQGQGQEEGEDMSFLLERDAAERLVNQLCLESVLAEDFHASMYSINAYVVIGYQAPALERGERRVWMEVVTAVTATAHPSNSKGSGDGGGRLLPSSLPLKRPAAAAAAASSSAEDVVEIEDSDEVEDGYGGGWEAEDGADDGDGKAGEKGCEDVDLTEGGEVEVGKAKGKGKGQLKKRMRRAAAPSSSDESYDEKGEGAEEAEEEEDSLLL